MRSGICSLLILACIAGISTPILAADGDVRYGVQKNLKAFPQSSAKETLSSLIKAIEAKNVEYALAHLADPEWVDTRVKDYGGEFGVLLKESTGKLVDDPGALKLLRRFDKEGEWETEQNRAQVKLKEIADKSVYFRKIGDRWFMENDYKPKKNR
ncbi:MAG: hypothetical protein ACJ8FY_04970 [Gemmataceae bacterium]